MDELSWKVEQRDDVTVIRLRGHLGLPDVPVVRGLLLKCLAECPAGVVVDLAELTVTRPVVLTVFPAVLRRAAPWPAVPVVLTGLVHSSVVPIYPSVDEAIAAVERGTPAGRVRMCLRPTVAAASDARRFTRDACAAWELDGVVDEAAVIVTELVDNAARHARTELAVTLAYRGVYLNIAVYDGSPEPACHRSPGKGLRLVDAFATAWGTLPTASGKTTWATVRVP
ncbi:ATPase [Cryptosporangium sp. NPDC048952]|uniref:ATPase n=1 Tax=Cryptosporangium sp. NPDC048952 TaxID=3363961 RepID=UPI003714A00C